jgi:cyclic beta-1,2-glucan synthetase
VTTPLPALAFSNGIGGFDNEGASYVIVLDGERQTPAPWANVIANPHFGTIVTESGAAHTWAANSRENRLTSFGADPIVDPTAEVLFIRDDESGDAWTPTPGPMKRHAASERCVVKHEAGLTHFSRVTGGLRHELDLFVDVEAPGKYSMLTLTNRGATVRRLSVFSCNDWVLGPPREDQHRHVITAFDAEAARSSAATGSTTVLIRSRSRTRASDRVPRLETVARSSAATARWPAPTPFAI